MINYPFNKKDAKNEVQGTNAILCDCRKRHTNLRMAWIDYKKAWDMVPHSWILETLKLVQVSDNILKRSIANWQTELTSCESLEKEKVWRKLTSAERFLRVINSPLLFIAICDIANNKGDKFTFIISNMHDTPNLCTMQSQGKIHHGRRREN